MRVAHTSLRLILVFHHVGVRVGARNNGGGVICTETSIECLILPKSWVVFNNFLINASCLSSLSGHEGSHRLVTCFATGDRA